MTGHLTIVNGTAWGGEMSDPDAGINARNAIAKHAVWLALEGKASTTITSRAGALHRAAAAVAPAELADATTDDLLRWRLALQGKADTYILAQVSHLRCFCEWLTEHGYRPDNPARRLPVPRKPAAIPHPIGTEQLEVAIRNAPDRIRLWLILAAFLGFRACEISGLLRRHIREHDRNPHIFISSDAAKGGYEAVIPLRGYALEQVLAAQLPVKGQAFPRLDGRPGPLSPHRVSDLCNEYLHSLGYADTLHSLRHYFGTATLRASGGNVRTTMRALRHRRLDTTAIYTLITDDEVAAAVAAIPAPRRLSPVPGRKAGAAAVAAIAVLAGAALPLSACTHQAAQRPAVARTARPRRPPADLAKWETNHDDRNAA